jgi:hypothetical protein
MPLRERLLFLQHSNYYNDYSGFIYALQEYVIDPATGARSAVRVKYGITNNIDRRQKQYTKCGDIEWLYYWPTDCVRITGEFVSIIYRTFIQNEYSEAIIHCCLKLRGIHVPPFRCSCGHHHREFFLKAGIGGLVDIREVVEEVLWDTAQAIMKSVRIFI